MSFIKMGTNLDDIQEEGLAPEGEYELEIVYVGEDKISDNDRVSFPVGVKICDPDQDAGMIFHHLAFPKEDDFTEKGGQTAKLMLRSVKRFFNVFSIPTTDEGFDKDDLMNATGKCGVVQKPMRDDDPESDIVNKLRLPRIG